MPFSFRHTLLVPALALSGLLVSAAVQAEPDEPIQLDFGVYSSNKPSAMVRVFKPTLSQLEDNMSRILGQDVDIRMQIAKDYDEGIQALTSGRVDFSAFGPSSYIEARRMNPDLQIIAMESIEASKVFYGIIAVHTDSDIRTLDDIRGRAFAFGDQGSTIGRFLSQLHLEKNDIRASDLARYDYLGRHDKVGTAVGAGDYDAGALNEKTFKKLVDAGEPIRELARFSNVTRPWIASSTIDPTVLKALRSALLELDDPRALAALKIDGFLEGSDADYERIRIAMEENDRFFAERDPVPLDTEHLRAAVKLERDAETVRLGVGLPAAIFDQLRTTPATRIVIELEVLPALGAASGYGQATAEPADESSDMSDTIAPAPSGF